MVKLDIVIVGGGIGGLSAAIFLAQDGHSVTVLEKQSEDYDSKGAGGIALFNNSKCIWKRRGMLDQVLAVAESGDSTHISSYQGQPISTMTSPESHSFVHRADLLRVLRQLARKHNATLRFGIIVESVLDDPSKPTVKLTSGEQIEADLIIASDGINSFIRRQFYPAAVPVLTRNVVMLVDVPKEAILADQGATELWNESPFHHTLGPRLNVVSWAMKNRQPPVYHLQFTDHDYDGRDWYGPDSPSGPLTTQIHDMKGFKERWHDFEPKIQHILNSIQGYTRWKIAEVPVIPSWSSPNRGFVLLGDAAHAIAPFAGQGANMSVEDGACLAELFSFIESKEELPKALEVYDALRMPRLAGIREIIKMNIEAFGAVDGSKAQQERNALLSQQNAKERNTSDTDWRKYGTKAGWVWTIGYDTITETKKAWTEYNSRQTNDTKL